MIIKKREQEPNSCMGLEIKQKIVRAFANGSLFYDWKDSGAIVSDGRWHHLAASNLGNLTRLFVDGKLVSELDVEPNFPQRSNSVWRIGYNPGAPGFELQAKYARIRSSSVARYHVPFEPERNYDTDRASLLLVK